MEASKKEEDSRTFPADEPSDQLGSLPEEKTKDSDASQEPAAKDQNEEGSASNDERESGMLDLLTHFLQTRFGISADDEPKREPVIEEFTLNGIAKYIKEGKCKNIIVMTGAGISTSAGIPDFRSPGTGLYDNLAKYELPRPESIFDIHYFKEKPEPFFMLARELFPGNYKPTPGHYFIKLLEEKKLLLRNFTQNIDGLELVAGVSSDRVIAAHGTFHTAHCLACHREYSQDWEKEQIFKGGIPKCEDCDGVVKPDIVFFGESLPSKFFSHMSSDFPTCDLLIVMGTSLVVQPFASLIDRVPKETPRLLINKEKCGMGGMFGGFDFDSQSVYRDVAHLSTCDDGCMELADLLGWKDDLKKLIAEGEIEYQEKFKKPMESVAAEEQKATVSEGDLHGKEEMGAVKDELNKL
ncbi:NAD-dependent protein deacetylase sirtuin-2-like [Rhopilema esculentum]|uniref:NAD-dependent protein deacetylase sirtuin-2-like n=1 Tax=Rhopilema esculentum TaxID=499914 RepID=UPI0031D724E4|eukprot:gene2784-1007_t